MGGGAPSALDATNQTIPVCSHHLPRRIERCVSVEAAGVWGSAYCASAHLADAKARELVEITTASGNAELERAAIREPDVDRERETADSDAPMGGDDTSCGRLGHPEAFSRTTFTSHCSTNHWPTNHPQESILPRAPRAAP